VGEAPKDLSGRPWYIDHGNRSLGESPADPRESLGGVVAMFLACVPSRGATGGDLVAMRLRLGRHENGDLAGVGDGLASEMGHLALHRDMLSKDTMRGKPDPQECMCGTNVMVA